MSRAIRPATCADVQNVALAIEHLKQARALLKSADGAARHVEHRATRSRA